MEEIHVFTDGSYQPSVNEKVAGWGWVIPEDSNQIDSEILVELSGIIKNPQSRQIDGEIEAVYRSLDYLDEILNGEGIRKNTLIKIHHDYNGLGFWGRGEWKTNKPLTRAYKGFIDQKRITGLNIEFVWTKGHDGEYWNEYADMLATSVIQNYKKEV